MYFFRKEFLPGLFIKRGVLIILKYLSREAFLPRVFFPEDLSAKAAMTLPRQDRDWLMAAPSFRRSPVAPVLSALSLKQHQCQPLFSEYHKWILFMKLKKKKLKWILLSQFYLYVYKNFKIIDIQFLLLLNLLMLLISILKNSIFKF